jgi:hypothetical protein
MLAFIQYLYTDDFDTTGISFSDLLALLIVSHTYLLSDLFLLYDSR